MTDDEREAAIRGDHPGDGFRGCDYCFLLRRLDEARANGARVANIALNQAATERDKLPPLAAEIDRLRALNAELVEALRGLLYVIRNDNLVPETYMRQARAALAKAGSGA